MCALAMGSDWRPLPSASAITECMCFESGRAGEPGYSGFSGARYPIRYTANHVGDCDLTGHAADMSKSTLMTQSGPLLIRHIPLPEKGCELCTVLRTIRKPGGSACRKSYRDANT